MKVPPPKKPSERNETRIGPPTSEEEEILKAPVRRQLDAEDLDHDTGWDGETGSISLVVAEGEAEALLPRSREEEYRLRDRAHLDEGRKRKRKRKKKKKRGKGELVEFADGMEVGRREARGHLFEKTAKPEPGDLSLTDPDEIADVLGSPAAYARHVMILCEAFRRSTGATRSEAIEYLTAMFVSLTDRRFGRVALKEFGPTSGIIDLYPLEVTEHILEHHPGFLPKVGFGRFVTKSAEQPVLQMSVDEPAVVEYPPQLKIRGFAILGGGCPGYLFEPAEEEGQYHLQIEAPGRFTLLMSAVNRRGHTLLDKIVAEVDGPPCVLPPEPYPPRAAEKVRAWPKPEPPDLSLATMFRETPGVDAEGLLSAAEIYSRTANVHKDDDSIEDEPFEDDDRTYVLMSADELDAPSPPNATPQAVSQLAENTEEAHQSGQESPPSSLRAPSAGEEAEVRVAEPRAETEPGARPPEPPSPQPELRTPLPRETTEPSAGPESLDAAAIEVLQRAVWDYAQSVEEGEAPAVEGPPASVSPDEEPSTLETTQSPVYDDESPILEATRRIRLPDAEDATEGLDRSAVLKAVLTDEPAEDTEGLDRSAVLKAVLRPDGAASKERARKPEITRIVAPKRKSETPREPPGFVDVEPHDRTHRIRTRDDEVHEESDPTMAELDD